MLLEIKTRNSYPRKGQKMMWLNIHNWIKKGIEKDWQYLGFNLIVFENTYFTDGKCFFNNTIISEKELIEKLSF